MSTMMHVLAGQTFPGQPNRQGNKMIKFNLNGEKMFKFTLGSTARDIISGFEGVVIYRTQWLNQCNTYGVKSRDLKDGAPQSAFHFDEPQLQLVEDKATIKPSRKTGGPDRHMPRTNR